MTDTTIPYYCGDVISDPGRHDGGLRLAVGASCFQVTRANRYRPELCEGLGWTYNHAADIEFFAGRFWIQYLSTPDREHIAPSVSLLARSANGLNWEKPRISFPICEIPSGIYRDAEGADHIVADGTTAVMHQRVGFYRHGGRVLLTGFYGNPDTPDHSPFGTYGLWRVCRELYADGGMGEIFTLSYNACAGVDESRLVWPMYASCEDKSFVGLCGRLLSDKLFIQQFLDEHGVYDERIPLRLRGLAAFNWYHIGEKKVVGLWKWSKYAVSEDNGESWSEPAESPTMVMAGGKQWGERTSDGRFAIVCNPSSSQDHRWPMAVFTSEDGIKYDEPLCVHGEVPDQRYLGLWKSYGPQYMRGLAEESERPPDGAMYIAYSVNKEDIWVARVPVPIAGGSESMPNDSFESDEPGGYIDGWNVYSPIRCPVRVKEYGGKKFLELRDADSADYARAVRVFKQTERLRFETRLQLNRAENGGELYIELEDGRGNPAAGITFEACGAVRVLNGYDRPQVCGCEIGRFYTVVIEADCANQRFELFIDGERVGGRWRFSYPARALERVEFRTGARRFLPNVFSSPDSAEFVRDIGAERDCERHEITALVEYIKGDAI